MLFLDVMAPYPGESLALRWLRMLALHPLRSLLGLGFLASALIPQERPTRPEKRVNQPHCSTPPAQKIG